MTAPDKSSPTLDRELVLTRIIDAPREKVFRAWTEPELLKQWFAPLPWTTPVAERWASTKVGRSVQTSLHNSSQHSDVSILDTLHVASLRTGRARGSPRP